MPSVSKRKKEPTRSCWTTRNFLSARRRLSRVPTATTRTSTEPSFLAAGLGGNQGNPEQAFRIALKHLDPFLSEIRVSSLYRTHPVGMAGTEPDFLNAVFTARTLLLPQEILSCFKQEEERAGRVASSLSSISSRPLDIDLLLYGKAVIQSERLTVPHPRLCSRRFVLEPLAELIPGHVVPGPGGKSIRQLLDGVADQKVERVSDLPWWP